MRKFLVALVGLGLSLILTTPSLATADESSPYAPYESHQELLEAYNAAVDSGDVAEQERLLEIGRNSLNDLIEECEAEASSAALTRSPITPGDTYWNSQFPNYFSSGSWITRSGVISLSLYPKNPITWTRQQTTYAWYATLARYSGDSRWANTNVMQEQFFCHWSLASWKSPWNIEPSKTSINPITCN